MARVARFCAPWSAIAVLTVGGLVDAELVDLSFVPTFDVVRIDDQFDVRVYATSAGSAAQDIGAIDMILNWDPGILDLVSGTTSGAGYAWFISGFLPDQDGINANLHDGNALYTVMAQPGNPAYAPPPPGLHVATFRFRALAATTGTSVAFTPAFGLYGRTRILEYEPANSNVTGDISSTAVIKVIQPCSPVVGDVNLDGGVDWADIAAAVAVLLGQDTDPDHVAAADANCDGVADGRDIQPLTDLLLLLL